MTEFRGRRDGSERRFCIVVSQFNVMVTDRLLEGARDELRENGVASDDIDVIYVPGAWELTSGVRSAVRRDYSGVLALGCVVRGETAHFDYICSSVTQGLTHLQLNQDTPIAFGLITAEDLAQAFERAGGSVGNLGSQAALAALEMSDLVRQLEVE
jgi:6,7-dimethyl-8-ribityllumazine synthase